VPPYWFQSLTGRLKTPLRIDEGVYYRSGFNPSQVG